MSVPGEGVEGGRGRVERPLCAKCRNHGLRELAMAHRPLCPFRTCRCPLCRLHDQRRQVMAIQVALRRRQWLDEAYEARERKAPGG